MKTLILLRHAKSSWDDPLLPDHERRLNKRGRAAAAAMGQWLGRTGLTPEAVLCSSARRARETVERMRLVLPALPEPAILSSLYQAAPEVMEAALDCLSERVSIAMLVGHEPGISAFTHALTGDEVSPSLIRAFDHFPTAAAAVLELDRNSWGARQDGTARFLRFQVPRELPPNE